MDTPKSFPVTIDVPGFKRVCATRVELDTALDEMWVGCAELMRASRQSERDARDAMLRLGWHLNKERDTRPWKEFLELREGLNANPKTIAAAMRLADAFADAAGRLDVAKVDAEKRRRRLFTDEAAEDLVAEDLELLAGIRRRGAR